MKTHSFSIIYPQVQNPQTSLQMMLEEFRKLDDGLRLPVRSDGTEYTIEALSIDQQKILAEVLGAVRNYLEKGLEEELPIFRMTVCGVAGSGKSTWINTLVTVLRKMFQSKNAVQVFAPTGSAAFTAGGETIHRGLDVLVDKKNEPLKPNVRQRLHDKLYSTVALIFDEKSMIDASTFGNAKDNCRQCAHGGIFDKQAWGGIPIIILVGDDFQLPPVLNGAFYALPGNRVSLYKTDKTIFQRLGYEEFISCGEKVAFLQGIKRVNDDQLQLKRILNAVRQEDDNIELGEEDIQRLLELHIHHPRFSREDRKKIEKDAVFVFANKIPRNQTNFTMLKKENLKGSPVARIKSKTINNYGRTVQNNHHYDEDREPSVVKICKNAIVSLTGYNPEPRLGLYHGSVGKVIEIVFNDDESPNDDFLPKYVLVEFAQYIGKEIVQGHPRTIPIIPCTVRCRKNCCSRTYIPLSLAFGKTGHTFQGTTVGPVPIGHPKNAIQKIIVDPGTRAFEGVNVGLLYQLLGRPTTIGTKEDKFSSAIYFTGPNFNRERITNLTKDAKGKTFKKAWLRLKWVNFLKENKIDISRWDQNNLSELFQWANNTKVSIHQES
jgi:hypothetical protein